MSKINRKRFFYDTEFIEDGRTIGLLSIGAVDEHGREFYAVNANSQVMTRAVEHDWLRANVLPYLPVTLIPPDGASGLISPPGWRWSWDTTHADYSRVMPHRQIARELLAFLDPRGCEPELWAWFGAYDHVAYAQLWGPMVELPSGLPMLTRELVQRWGGRRPTPEARSARQRSQLAGGCPLEPAAVPGVRGGARPMTLPPPVTSFAQALMVLCSGCQEPVTLHLVGSVHVTPSPDGGSLFSFMPTWPASAHHDCGVASKRREVLASHVHVFEPPARDWDEVYDRDEEMG